MASRNALEHPEGGYVLAVDIDLASDAVVCAIKTTAAAFPQNALPHPDARLNIPMPSIQESDTSMLKVAMGVGNPAGREKPSKKSTGQSILEMFDELHRSAPEGAFDELPRDLSRNYKHYLYGFPKDED